MKFILLLIFLLLGVSFSSSQEVSPGDADSLVRALKKSKPDVNRVYMLLKLAEYQILKPDEFKVDLDSAETYLHEAKQLNKLIKSTDADGYRMLVEGKLLKAKGQKDEARKLVEAAVVVLKRGNNKAHLGKAYVDLSGYYDRSFVEQSQSQISLLEEARVAFRQGGDLKGEATSLKMLGDLYNQNYEDEKSLEALKLSLTLYDSINYKRVHEIYDLLGNIYNDQSDYKQALSYELKALAIAKSLHDSTMQLYKIHSTLGGIYSNIGRGDVAVIHYKAALEIAKRFDDGFSIGMAILDLTTTYHDIQQPKKALEFLLSQPKKYLNSEDIEVQVLITVAYFSAYIAVKKYDYAKTYCDKLLKLVNDPALRENNLFQNGIYVKVVRYFIETGQLSKARTYLNINKENIECTPHPWIIADNAALWYKVDSADGNFKAAFNHLLTYQTITDSIYQATKSRQFQLIQVEYETKKREDSIRQKSQDILLLTQKNTQQQANLDQAVIVRNVVIVGTTLILSILILLYRQYRLKQKNSRVIKNKNELLQHWLNEKEWLLKEIHHRVKNNLQTVMSLLNSQSAYIQNDVAFAAIQDSQHRVHAMSLIHQKLYSSENVSSIDMPAYIRELVEYMRDCFNTGQRIRFELNIEALELDVSQAVPLGLILNEAITNSIKYAFPEDRKGIIQIDLKHVIDDQYLLSISDNGIGMPDNLHTKKAGSLGLSLIKGLSEDLDGTFNIESSNGTLLTISFIRDVPINRMYNTIPEDRMSV